jgi:hypothetical protein
MKPKLDKFILMKMGQEADSTLSDRDSIYKKGIKVANDKNRLVGKGKHSALDYKVKLNARFETKNEKPDKRDPLYFGNMGDGKDKHFISPGNENTDFVFVEFFSFQKEIINEIEKYFAEFLMKNNFGTRQSKGFGSFYIDESDENYIEPEKVLENHFYLSFIKNGDVRDNISVIYRLMKSGINFPDYPMIEYTDHRGKRGRRPDPEQGRGKNEFYFKSFLSEYFLAKKIGNEKHFIKENFFHPGVRIRPDGLEKRYIRSVLGVAGSVEFKDKDRKGIIEYKSDEIERFKSPILFKVIGESVYMLPEIIPEKIKNLKFEFICRSNDSNNKSRKEIYTPDTFDLKDFMKKYAEHFNHLNRTVLEGKNGRLHNIINATKDIRIKIHEV